MPSSLLSSAACNCPSTGALALLPSPPVLAVLIWIESALAPEGKQVGQQEAGTPAGVDIGRARAGVRAVRDRRQGGHAVPEAGMVVAGPCAEGKALGVAWVC